MFEYALTVALSVINISPFAPVRNTALEEPEDEIAASPEPMPAPLTEVAFTFAEPPRTILPSSPVPFLPKPPPMPAPVEAEAMTTAVSSIMICPFLPVPLYPEPPPIPAAPEPPIAVTLPPEI